MPGKGVDVGDDERPAGGGGRSADSFAEGDPHARGHALKRAEHELRASREVEAAPVDAVERPGQMGGSVGQVRERVVFLRQESRERDRELPVARILGERPIEDNCLHAADSNLPASPVRIAS